MEHTLENVTAAVVPAIAMTDGELLMQYARHGDEGAFAEIVEKHGRLVWTVCWQVLRQHHEIEDAFQSTFFILARRASSIRSSDSLCGWLYRVAYRTAVRARMTAKRKPLLDLNAEDVGDLDRKLQDIELHDQRAVLLEELHTLPEQYQQALVLCYLEGKTRRQIAEELGCSLEAIKGRLSRGRQVLRHRLIRRGVSLSLAMGAMTVPVKAASVAVTPQLVGITASASTAWALGGAKAATTVSSQVIHLAHQGTIAMTISSLAKPAVLAVALLGAVTGTLAVDSNNANNPGTDERAATINLQAGADAVDGKPAQEADENSVELVVATEDATAVPDGASTIEVREGKLKVVGPVKMRNPSPVGPADVVVPGLPRVPAPPRTRSFVFGFTNPESLKFQIKLADLERNVSELRLKGKQLEINALEVQGKEREELMEAARKKQMEAEAMQLSIQIEKQQQQIKELEEAVRQQAEGFAEQAEKLGVALDTDIPEEQARLYERQAEALQAQAAEAARSAQSDRSAQLVAQAKSLAAARSAAAAQREWQTQSQIQVLSGDLELQPGDTIRIEAMDVRPDRPIEGEYIIEPMGTVALGVAYGRVKVEGLSLVDAEKALTDHLQKDFQTAKVQVTFVKRALITPENLASLKVKPEFEDSPFQVKPDSDDTPFEP